MDSLDGCKEPADVTYDAVEGLPSGDALDGAVLKATSGWATDVKRRFVGDFSAWESATAYKQAFDRLLRDLKAEPGEEGD